MRTAEPTQAVVMAPEFLSVMSHELAQPLTAALGSASLLKDRRISGELDDATRGHLVDTVIRNLEQLQALLDSLRVFSEAEAGRLKIEPATESVEELFSEAQEDFGTPSSEITVSFTCEPGLHIQVELMLFRQVLSNIISNAAKFSPNGSVISVNAHKADEEVVVTVSDEGGGFPAEEAERIFGKSVRLRPGKKGLGVGLFVARAIVEAHGGRIWAENTDAGARFSVAIPAA